MQRKQQTEKKKEKKATVSKVPLIIHKYKKFISLALGIGAFLFISFLAFYQLGKAPMENWDEAWYADATRNMLQMKEFFVLYWNESPWLDKPPMYMWLSALFSTVFGFSEFSLRFTSALSGVIIVMLVSIFAYRNYGFVPALLAFITVALNNVFIWRMRSGNLDLLASLLILLVFLVQVSKWKYKYPFLGLLFACIYLTKASLVLLPIAVFVLYEVLFERKQIIARYKQYLILLAIAIALPSLWLGAASLQIGPHFAQYYLFKSDQGVASVSLDKFNLDYIMYTYYSLQRRFAFVLIIGVLFALRYIKDPKAFLMLVYGSALVLQLSFTERSNNWYLLPAMAFWSLLIAYGTYHSLKLFRNNIVAAAIVVAVSTLLAYRTFTINILPILDTSANVALMQSSKEINTLTREGDTIVRLDHLYPTTIFYSERKVLASPEGNTDTIGYWIAREEVSERLQKKTLKWVVGSPKDVEAIKAATANVEFRERKVNNEEVILEALN
jgi:4-amino-4-deoxy-L-arabinose transferase-like glycosyltransferase